MKTKNDLISILEEKSKFESFDLLLLECLKMDEVREILSISNNDGKGILETWSFRKGIFEMKGFRVIGLEKLTKLFSDSGFPKDIQIQLFEGNFVSMSFYFSPQFEGEIGCVLFDLRSPVGSR